MSRNVENDRTIEKSLREIALLLQEFGRDIRALQLEVGEIRRDLHGKQTTLPRPLPDTSSRGIDHDSIPSTARRSAQSSDTNAEKNRVLLTVEQVADMLGVSASTVRRMIARGELPVIRIGLRSLRIHRQAIDAKIEH
jgi:excisionase family DNA binding protein